MKKIISVAGARPNFMKIAPLNRALKKYSGSIQNRIVHTGQHYDDSMSKVFFDDLELPKPDVYLGVGSGSHAQQTAKVMVEFEKVVEKDRPDLVVVVGDVNSTVACSLVSAKAQIPVAHVEAGLRSFDRTMPEEINRIVTDSLSDLLFVSEKSGLTNLRHEGIDEKRISFVGNIMIDSLVIYRDKAKRSRVLNSLVLDPQSFALVTLHRPSNVDRAENLSRILESFREIADKMDIVFPIHPRTRKALQSFGLQKKAESIKQLKLIDPVGYIDFLALMENAKLIITDSGGIQEETTYLGIPCLTMRKNTERPSTVEVGTNQLCGEDFDRLMEKVNEILAGKQKRGTIPELWDGKTAERIAEILSKH
ncbi:MAG TPA: UDP-N-acetylglucosamine 2-epimerase (non-hydrolyzing) [Bacteroidota bacterium]|nr:UDP-N-acetylglucosamine 2-epimerase (non-hydrolyzing) [Bacteroidota bacterium]